ncbi:hypothetical protein A5724_14735 [Mycobacterium sp. ACS1612]|nr:hypothetical protein A5724_14735 [Mycobacterium sp. ACS1612]
MRSIVGVHDRGEADGQLWISLERHPAGMSKAGVARIVTAVAEARDYAHERGLLHRDGKPVNILLSHPKSSDQRILLADFGIARWVNDISGATQRNLGMVAAARERRKLNGDN